MKRSFQLGPLGSPALVSPALVSPALVSAVLVSPALASAVLAYAVLASAALVSTATTTAVDGGSRASAFLTVEWRGAVGVGGSTGGIGKA